MKIKNPRIMNIHFDDKKRPFVCLEKRLKDFEILKTATIRCDGYPSLWEGIQAYISKHINKPGVKITNIGVVVTGRQGYINAQYNSTGCSYKKVVFYKINDHL